MTNAPIGRKEFLEAMSDLQGQFDDAGEAVKSHERAFNRSLRDLMEFLRHEPLALAGGGELPDDRAKEELAKTLQLLDDVIFRWRDRVDKYERNTKFHRDHGDSLLVYIYGLVKTGKSSLGNFVAHGRHDPDDEFVSGLTDKKNPHFFVRSVASGNEADFEEADRQIARRRRFHANVEEATDRIQGFKLPGLTWIDSPGLGSVTEANGKLAREYVDSADLVLVTMSSAQPGRRPEFDEVRELMGRGKPMMVLITRADEIAWDEVEGEVVKELVMKSARDRDEMTEWVASQFEELALNGTEIPKIVPVSVLYAEKHAHSAGALESGMSELFGLLREIAGGSGVAMKRETPANNLRHFIGEVVGDGDKLGAGKVVGSLTEFVRSLAKSCEIVGTRIRQAGALAERDVTAMIEREVKCRRAERDSEGLRDAINEQSREIIERRLHEAAAEVMEQIGNAVRALVGPGWDPAEFEAVTEDVPITVRERTATGGGLGALLGAAVGFIAGGPAGAAAGAAIGGAVGNAVAGTRDKTMTMTVEIGDNAGQVAEEWTGHMRQVIKTKTDSVIEQMSANISVWTERTEEVIGRVERFRNDWREQVKQIGELP